MSTRPPAVTVVMATYNWSEVLPFSIGSVLLQSFADFELLVIGDGCTDDSEKVVGAIGDPRVRWINLPVNNGHQSGPNNEGVRQARGEFVAYLGHDDLWLPHHLSCLVAALEDGSDLAYGATQLVPPQGTGRLATSGEAYVPGMWVPPSSVLHRRNIIERVGGWRDCRALDVDPENDLWRRIHEAGCRLAFVPRLTLIKFPATWRRNVYRERPHHEQEAWLDRIRREPDLEPVALTKMLVSIPRTESGKSYKVMIAMLVAETLRRARSLGQGLVPHSRKRGRELDRRRSFKGLGPLRGDVGKKAEAGQPVSQQDLGSGEAG